MNHLQQNTQDWYQINKAAEVMDSQVTSLEEVDGSHYKVGTTIRIEMVDTENFSVTERVIESEYIVQVTKSGELFITELLTEKVGEAMVTPMEEE